MLTKLNNTADIKHRKLEKLLAKKLTAIGLIDKPIFTKKTIRPLKVKVGIMDNIGMIYDYNQPLPAHRKRYSQVS